MPSESFSTLFATYAAGVRDAPNEDSIKHHIQTLIETYGALHGRTLQTNTEDSTFLRGVRPDIAVREVIGGTRRLVGWIELKAPGKSLPGRRGYSSTTPGLVRDWSLENDGFKRIGKPNRHDTKQWAHLSELPNIVYCNGLGIGRYESGNLVDASDSSALPDNHLHRTAATSLDDIAAGFERVLGSLLDWTPVPPRSMRQIAAQLAPLTRALRDTLLAALASNDSATVGNKQAWTTSLMGDGTTNATFADGFAQAGVFAILFARLDGAPSPLGLQAVRDTIATDHGLLAQVVERLTTTGTPQAIRDALETVMRYADVIDPTGLASRNENPWHDFYEYFIAEYDPAHRNDTGVYYTPREIVDFQVEQCHEALLELGYTDSFASQGVRVIDPATGSGTYLLSIIERTRRHLSETHGAGIAASLEYAKRLRENLHGIEVAVGAYSIAQLRISRALADMTGEPGMPPAHIYLADTLSDPWSNERADGQLAFFVPQLVDEQARANELKQAEDVTVIIGNPPYDRQESSDGPSVGNIGGWVRWEPRSHAARSDNDRGRPLFDDFMKPAVERGHGSQAARAIHNLYMYFWRWACWKAFETHTQPAIVSFIHPISSLTGVGAAGFRAWLRQHADEIVTVDLLGDVRGARKTENVFTGVQTPVGITTAKRKRERERESSHHQHAPWGRVVLRGTARQRLDRLAELTKLSPSMFTTPIIQGTLETDLFADVTTAGAATFRSWPTLPSLFSARSGVKPQRQWVWAETDQLARSRWQRVKAERDPQKRALLVHENRDTHLHTRPSGLLRGQPLASLSDDPSPDPEGVVRAQYRALDEHWLVADARVITVPSTDLWRVHAAPNQQYLVSRFVTEGAGRGPVCMITDLIPDYDCSNPVNGGRADVAPLYRDADGTMPNVNPALIDALSHAYFRQVKPADVHWYANGVLGTGAYTERFWDELEQLQVRLPFPQEADLFSSFVELGRHLAWLTCYGRIGAPLPAFDYSRHPIGNLPPEARTGPTPGSWNWNRAQQTLSIEGQITMTGVSESVMDFAHMGRAVVPSWLGYRMKQRARGGRAVVTPLDDQRPEWTLDDFVLPLQRLLVAVHHLVSITPAADELLSALVDNVLELPPLPTPPGEFHGGRTESLDL